MYSAKPWLYGLIKEKSSSKVLEVPKSPWIKGVSILWPKLHLHLYILRGNPILEASIHYDENPLPWQPPRRGKTSSALAPTPRKEENSRGHCPPGQLPPIGSRQGFPATGTASSPCQRRHGDLPRYLHVGLHLFINICSTSPSSPCCNLLTNMTCIAIYDFSMIYCVSMHLFE
jgi:hypothetical protein